jgi:hypothetical protein
MAITPVMARAKTQSLFHENDILRIANPAAFLIVFLAEALRRHKPPAPDCGKINGFRLY